MFIIEWMNKKWKDWKRNKELYFTAENGHLNVVEELIAAGAHFHQNNNTGDNALNIATKKYNKEVIDNLKKLSLEQKNKVTKDYKYYNNPTFQKQYQEKWLKNTYRYTFNERNIFLIVDIVIS